MRFVNDYGKTRSFNPRPSVRGDLSLLTFV